jgi:hypothetical protein
MLFVMIVIMTMTALAAVHQRHLNAALRIEQARINSENGVHGPRTVLAVAIDRLKTGDAPAPVVYSYSHTVASTTALYRISYTRSGTRWTVTAEPDPAVGALPALPTSF